MDSPLALFGKYIRLEPLAHHHINGLAAAATVDPSLYQWSTVPQGHANVTRYVETALSWQDNGSAITFAITREADNTIIGSTRFWNIEHWPWPQHHPRSRDTFIDGCEIGYTWLAATAIRTAANTEAKLLMLTHAFETWKALRVCFHTDIRNDVSRAALDRIGAKFEGLLRAHRLAIDHTPRDSARYSIIADEWPEKRARLLTLLRSYQK